MSPQIKRLFVGMQVEAPWPEKLPSARLIKEENRHLTLCFLGKTDIDLLPFSALPKPPFKVALTGSFDQCIFMPHKHPRCVAWQVNLEDHASLMLYQRKLHKWLEEQLSHKIESHPFLPHVTIGRDPDQCAAWKKCFSPLPCTLNALHLYESPDESRGSHIYQRLFSIPLFPAFEEIQHTADIAYIIRGASLPSLLQHAKTALSFAFPPLLAYTAPEMPMSLEDIVIALNEIIARADGEIGCPFKAVSFHGKIEQKEHFLEWEMVVDV